MRLVWEIQVHTETLEKEFRGQCELDTTCNNNGSSQQTPTAQGTPGGFIPFVFDVGCWERGERQHQQVPFRKLQRKTEPTLHLWYNTEHVWWQSYWEEEEKETVPASSSLGEAGPSSPVWDSTGLQCLAIFNLDHIIHHGFTMRFTHANFTVWLRVKTMLTGYNCHQQFQHTSYMMGTLEDIFKQKTKQF